MPIPAPVCKDPIAALVLPPRLNDADRAEIAREIDAAGDALWVRVLMAQSGAVEAARRAQAVQQAMQVPSSSTPR